MSEMVYQRFPKPPCWLRWDNSLVWVKDTKDRIGHLAVVVSENEDGTVTVIESNKNYKK